MCGFHYSYDSALLCQDTPLSELGYLRVTPMSKEHSCGKSLSMDFHCVYSSCGEVNKTFTSFEHWLLAYHFQILATESGRFKKRNGL